MVMNCMFYGEISGSSIAPIYNGEIITNVDNNKGVSNFNYFRLESSYIQNTAITKVYNCALGAETRFLQRFEFFRHLLNSNRELASWWATGSRDNKDEMMKWVMEPSRIGTSTPYPILKAPKDDADNIIKYPSVVNIDVNHSATESAIVGPKVGKTLSVTINSGGNAPTGASITTSSLSLEILDKDPTHFNFNYYKVQLPYYNDVGTKNYTDGKVVTGWKIVSITGGKADGYSTGADVTYTDGNLTATPYNFADRKCTGKDLYETSGRVFNQGAYWDVPEGVTAITIEPYWGKAVYLGDAYIDVVYNINMTTAYNVTTVGGGQHYNNGESTFNGQKVYTTMENAVTALNPSGTVYDNAVVLVGNYHEYSGKDKTLRSGKPYTVTSIDHDGDNEPDYSFIWRFDGRTKLHPVRYDFLNLIGLGMAQKSTGGTGSYNFGIPQPLDWFEVTNTALFRVTQFEYSPAGRAKKPIILQGGVIEQWVTQQQDADDKVSYFHVGGNVWFKEFHRGSHQDNAGKSTPHPPLSVTGGDFAKFYLTGYYQSQAAIYDDNAECYINGGRFGEMAGAGMEGIGTSDGKGNITWVIDNADIKEFYGGGINHAKPVHGNIHTIISNSHVGVFCGGPKFGDMESGRTVTTTATNCTFGTYFGAGYGGNSYSRYAPRNHNNIINFPHNDSSAGNHTSWNDWLSKNYKNNYDANKGGISTQFDYQFLPMSGNVDNVARIFVDYVGFSLAICNNVTSSLTGCTITGNFYGGGSLGKVEGNVTSTLTDCSVNGSVFGAGFSGSIPTVEVDAKGFETEPYYYKELGTYRTGVKGNTTTYTWQHGSSISVDNNKHILYTTEDLSSLGTVTGKATLNIGAGTTVTGNVYGGGESSDATGDVEVNVNAGTVNNDVYGGGMGKNTVVAGDVVVNIGAKDSGGALSGSGSVSGNVYGGSAFGKTTLVNMYGGSVTGSVYGGGKGDLAGLGDDHADVAAQNFGNTTVNMEGGTVGTAVYGGADTNGILKQKSTVTITGGTVGTLPTGNNPVKNVVFGGGFGQPTLVEGDVEVNIGTSGQTSSGAVFNGNVYGGGALGSVNAYMGKDSENNPELKFNYDKNTKVNLYKGTIKGDVFGGGLGQKNGVDGATSDVAAYVGGDVIVTLDGADVSKYTTGDNPTRIPGQIFGCNNLNGTPKGHVTVHVIRTVDSDKSEDTEFDDRRTYDITAVYGGGNQADYVPADALLDPEDEGNKENIEKACTKVIIDGCDATSIEYVYGGGNAAAVPATEITINGCYIIDQVFGGGNGAGFMDSPTNSVPNPGADIGYYKVNGINTPYGTGMAVTKLIGGQIHVVYGGSNTKGNVRGGTKMERKDSNTCPLKIGEIYGAGQQAQMDGSVNIILECMPEDFVDKVFGGAKNATINGNVELTVTSGKFGRVFGGNNEGGSINGSITVNVYEDGCKPLIQWFLGNQ